MSLRSVLKAIRDQALNAIGHLRARLSRPLPDVAARPPFDRVTAVLLTYHRPMQLRRVVGELMRCGIATIIVANDGSRRPRWANGSVTWLQASRNTGLDTRFAAALLARTELVLMLDDDLHLSAASIATLVEAASTEDGMVGTFGRGPTDDNRYRPEQTTNAEMILIGGSVFRRELLPLFFAAREAPVFVEARRQIAQLTETHPENGEDIIFSYAVKQAFGSPGRVLAVEATFLRAGGRALSASSQHVAARTIMMRAGQEYAAQLATPRSTSRRGTG